MKGQRLFYIDTAAGFLILYMINFHLSDWNWCTKYDPVIPTSWFDFAVPFMAWFFYKAGMFHKEHTIKETILGGYKKLIIPFLVFTVIGHILHCIRLWVEFDTTSWVDYIIYPFASILIRGAANGNFALWFLLSLFFVKVIISILEKYNVNLIIAGIIFFALGALLDIVCQELSSKFFPLYFGNTCLGLFFYLMGKYLRNFQYKWVVFIICTIGYVVITYIIHSGKQFKH